MPSARRLTLFDCVAIGINGIVGSGIFLLPRYVASGAQGFGPLAFVACGALCTLVALCYAEVGGMYERSGGTYLYAREAFGDAVGAGVGWLVLVSAVLGYATVARGLGDEAARSFGGGAGVASALAAALVLLLGAANWFGVKSGARTSDALTVAKLAPLLLFVLVGLFFVRGDRLAALGAPSVAGFAEGTFSALFALSGFEFVAVVAGETENPRRNIPLALVGSLLGAVVLYSLIQLVASGILPGIAEQDASLVETARAVAGAPGAGLMRAAAFVSMLGYCSGSALVGPQLVASLSRDGVLPGLFARRHALRQTPHAAVLLVSGSALAAVLLLDFKALADLTIITLFCQYVPTCLAVLVFRRRRPEAPRSFRIPFGPTVPLLALTAIGALVLHVVLEPFGGEGKSLAWAAAIIAIGGGLVFVGRKLGWSAAEGDGGVPPPALSAE